MREWQHYQNLPVRAVFEELLFCANTKAKTRQHIKINRGETIVSISMLQENTGLSRKTVIKALKTLEESGEIIREDIPGWYTKRTKIINFSKYQGEGKTTKKSGGIDTPLPTPPDTPKKPESGVQGGGINTPPPTPKQEEKEIKNNIEEEREKEKKRSLEEKTWAKELLQSTHQIEVFCMQEHITPNDFEKYYFAVMNEWEMTGTTHTDRSDMKRHLLSTIRKKIQSNGTNTNRKTYNEQRQAEVNQLACGVAATIARRLKEDEERTAGIREPEPVPF